jgi:hypothetical protein
MVPYGENAHSETGKQQENPAWKHSRNHRVVPLTFLGSGARKDGLPIYRSYTSS